MDQNRWNVINRIFHAALEVDPGERAALVATESNGDPELEEEVQLLLQADAEAGSYLESPLLPVESLLPSASPVVVGGVLCGRFRIVREIAEGGMGHVFEAFDSELSVRVALKVIRPEIVLNPEAIARFRREVRLARTITHPNVCRTFDIQREIRVSKGKRSEVVFLTMEFLSGETLAEKIKREGKLPLHEASDLARQIASALHAAHALNIIHRDMKPANIMLVPADSSSQDVSHAVVTDFGLARLDPLTLVDGQSSFTNTGQPIGTLAYMAPEQLDGTPVSPATDIYSFGLILFEVITGERAFPSTNLLSGIGQRLRGSFPLERLRAAKVPVRWRHAIEDCLAVDPTDRPRDVAAVIAMLEDGGQIFHRLRRTSEQLRRMLPRTLAFAAVFLIAMALFAGVLRLYKSRTDSSIASGALVYLTQVKNGTGEKSLDNLTELIRASLSQSTQINLLDQSRVGDILQQMTKSPESAIDAPAAREVAMRTGTARVVFATVTRSKNMYSLNVDIQQPDNTPSRYREHWARSFSWQRSSDVQASGQLPGELLKEVRSASNWIRHEAGESANDIARLDTPPEDATTSNWEALESYSDGERLFRRRDLKGAVNELKMALKIDPHFALANALLGDLEVELNDPKEGFAAYGRALDLNVHQRLSLRERNRIKGIVAHDNADFEGAEAAYREYTLYYPTDYLAWFRRGRPLLMLNRPEESAEVLIKAHTLDSSRSGIVSQIVRAELVRGDFAQANYWLDQLKVHYSKGDYLYELGQAQFVMGDYTEAANSLEEVSRGADSALVSSAVQILADLHAEQGDYEASIEILNGRLKSKPDSPGLLIDRAQLECKLNKYDECLTDLRQVLASDGSPRRIIAASAIAGQAVGSGHGAKTVKLRLFLNSLNISESDARLGIIFELARHRIRGEQLLADRKTKAALAEFLQADALDAPFMARDYLARALVMAAADETDATKAQDMVAKARACLSSIATRPAVVWQFPPTYPPGFYADQLVAWLQLPRDPSIPVTERGSILQALRRLRPTAANKFHNPDPSTSSLGGGHRSTQR